MNGIIQFVFISLVLFVQFLIASLAYPLFVACVGNYIAGVMSARKKGGFDKAKAIEGLIEMVELFIIFTLSAWFVYSIRNIKYNEIAVFSELFKVLVVLMVAYKGNSLLINLVPFSKIPMPKIMVDFDNHIKSLFKSDTPIGGINLSVNVNAKDLLEELKSEGTD